MASELVYTSAEHGLKPRSSGFCTVAMTHGMSTNLCERLESLSGYRTCFPSHDPRAAHNPVHFSYYRFSVGGITYLVLSRVTYYGVDYTGRSNKLAHHVVLREDEAGPEGPTAVALHPSTFCRAWQSEPKLISAQRRIEAVVRPESAATYWQQVVGDAGWAGIIAQHTLQAPDNTTALLFSPGAETPDLLRLLDECMMLIPPAHRWSITFSTYLTDMPTGTTCRWRCLLANSPEWERIRRAKNLLVLDLTHRPWQEAADGPLVTAARTGQIPYDLRVAATPATTPQLSAEQLSPVRISSESFSIGNDNLANIAKDAMDGSQREPSGPRATAGRSTWWYWALAAGILLPLAVGTAWFVSWIKAPPKQRELATEFDVQSPATAIAPIAVTQPFGATSTQVAVDPIPAADPVSRPSVATRAATASTTAPAPPPDTQVVSTRTAPHAVAQSLVPGSTKENDALKRTVEVAWREPTPPPDAMALVRLWHELKQVGRWHTLENFPKIDKSRLKFKVTLPKSQLTAMKWKQSDPTLARELTLSVVYEDPNNFATHKYFVYELTLEPLEFSRSARATSPNSEAGAKSLRDDFLRLVTQGSIELRGGERLLGRFEFCGLKDLDLKLKEATKNRDSSQKHEEECKDELTRLEALVKQKEAILTPLVKSLNLPGAAELEIFRKNLRTLLNIDPKNDKERDELNKAMKLFKENLAHQAKADKATADQFYDALKESIQLEAKTKNIETTRANFATAVNQSKAAQSRVDSLQKLHKEVENEQQPFQGQ